MPEFPLPEDFALNPLKSLTSAYAILIYMAYPDDEETREKKLQLLHIETLEQLKKIDLPNLLGVPPEMVQRTVEDVFETDVLPNLYLPEDTISVLLNSEPVTDLKHRLSYGELPKDWITVGYLGITLLTMKEHDFPGKKRDGVSKSKAVELLAALKIKSIHMNTKDINLAWMKYRSVSHFCVAYKILTDSEEYQQRFDMRQPQGLINFLAVAQHVQRMLLDIRPKYSGKTRLLQKDDVWYLPEWLKFKSEPIEMAPFGQKEIGILQKYKR